MVFSMIFLAWMLIKSYIFVSNWKNLPYMLITSYTGIWYCRVHVLKNRSDTGIYKFVATTPNGTDETEMKLEVLTPPEKPCEPFECFDIKADSCSLSWEPPQDDGGVEIQFYNIYSLDSVSKVSVQFSHFFFHLIRSHTS